MALTFWISLGILVYVTIGYPFVLRLILLFRGPRPVHRKDVLPAVSLVISAYNEASSLRQKLRNALELEYPRSLLEIVVVSDASDDGTDDIVREFEKDGVRLFRQDERRGKTAGLNKAVPTLSGDVIVFSDANALYQPDALRMLVRNFADAQVGCVTGEARYQESSATAAEAGEMAYWNYEITLKRLESAVGSMVGGDGAIYAIRASLWRDLPENAINDFLNPLQIVVAGWRAIYEPAAICYEETAGSAMREYRRRVRIVGRSWRAIFQEPRVLNPFRVGLFTLSVVSHKILRWLTGVFLLLACVTGLAISRNLHPPVAWVIGVAIIASMSLALRPIRRMASYAGYFIIVSLASIVGLVNGTLGRVSATWTPPRARVDSLRWLLGGGRVVGGALALIVVILLSAAGWFGRRVALEGLFWVSFALLIYVYAGYPLLVAALRPMFRKPVRREPMVPRVCLLITANDEESVIDAKLRNSLQLDYPADRLRIVVASDGSVDRTNAIVRSYAAQGVVLLEFPQRRGKIAAINDAMAAVDEEIVVFSDANTFLAPSSIRALVRNFSDAEIGAVSGDVTLIGERAALARSEDLYYRYERWLQQAESDMGSMIGVDGALYAIRRELFVPPPVDTILDDLAIPMAVIRAEHRIVFDHEALAFEYGSETAVEEFARKSRVTAGAVQFLRRRDSAVPIRNFQVVLALTSHKALRWLSPAFAIITFAASAALARDSWFFGVVATVQAVSLGIAAVGCVASFRRWGPIGFAHYFWLVQTAAAVGVVRGLRGRQPVAWRRFQRATVEAS
jgi:cellulose synthase/poly-beta-1,6-N-acetylglucosamine synthase-like glycosyltransferase